MGSRILLIDDDIKQMRVLQMVLEKAGYEVSTLTDPTTSLEKIEAFKPQIIILDLMMPQVDGFTVLRRIRDVKEFAGIKIVVMSAKSFPSDEARAYELGADDFVVKPFDLEKLRERIKLIASDDIIVTIWGSRGTYPTPSGKFLKYGGNTSCVAVEMSRGRTFIFDAGTGIIGLGEYLLTQHKRQKFNICISHPHWDHIHGFPFFKPAFMQGNEIAVFGPPNGDISLREVIGGQMKSIYFPITIRDFSARLYFKELGEGQNEVDGVSLDTILLNHPGNTLGYKLTDPATGKIVAYVTDNEIPPKRIGGVDSSWRDKLVNFLKGADLLIHDTAYFDNEYLARVGWGHPPISEVMQLAVEAEVKQLCLFHHEPTHNDDKVAEKEAFALKWAADHKANLKVFAAVEGSVINL